MATQSEAGRLRSSQCISGFTIHLPASNAVKRGMSQGWLTHQHCWEIRLEAVAGLMTSVSASCGPAGCPEQLGTELAAWKEWCQTHVVGKGAGIWRPGVGGPLLWSALPVDIGPPATRSQRLA